MAFMMKTSQKMAVRTTSARVPMAARPLVLRSLRAVPEDKPASAATPPLGPGETPVVGPGSDIHRPTVNPVTAISTEAKTSTLGGGVPVGNAGGVPPPHFQEVMGFNGAAPELINGRLAMLGFTAAVGAELSTGHSIWQQVKDEPTLIGLTFALFIAASLFPAFQRKQGLESAGPFTPKAEMWNGRAAMIGFAAMVIYEGVRHAPLF